MDQSSIDRAADLLAQAHRTGTRLPGLADADTPQDDAGAWAIQRAVLARLGGRIGGFKAAVPPGQPGFGAIMPAAGLKASPASLGLRDGETIGIEAEIAFRVMRPVRPGAGRDEILDAVIAFPAIELVVSRFDEAAKPSQLARIADNFSNGGFVAGQDAPAWRDLDLARLHVHLTIGDAVIADKVGGNPAGDPVVPLVWLAGFLPGIGLELEVGQVVTTGSCTGLVPAKAGQRVVARFAGLGDVVIDC